MTGMRLIHEFGAWVDPATGMRIPLKTESIKGEPLSAPPMVLKWLTKRADPPPLNWSTVRYVFGHEKEDRKCR